MKGVSEDEGFEYITDEGFDTDAVKAYMNTIEFSLRENNTGSFPRGLSLMLRSISKWFYDMNPFEPLKYGKPLQDLKSRLAKEGSKSVFSPLIEKFILNNPHRVTVEMQPDPEKAAYDEATEKEILQKVKGGMTTEYLVELTCATHELQLKHETPDPQKVSDVNGVKVLQHDLFTNDVIYTEIVFNMSSLKQELLPLVPLFCQTLLEMGTKDLTFVQLNQLIGRKTGGISVYPFTSSVRVRKIYVVT